jgi:hypothetical protein
MNSKFLWISGSINSGKSTIAMAAHKRIKKSVNIEIDHLRHFAENNTIDEIMYYVITDSLDLAKKWSERGYFPILSWPLWGEGLELVQNYSSKLGLELILINLTPSKEIALRNRGERDLNEKELKKINHMYDEAKISTPEYGHIIDNSFQLINETTEEVIKIISEDIKIYL